MHVGICLSAWTRPRGVVLLGACLPACLSASVCACVGGVCAHPQKLVLPDLQDGSQRADEHDEGHHCTSSWSYVLEHQLLPRHVV